jgi:sugar/nucleoside kinase (ribokinase family)
MRHVVEYSSGFFRFEYLLRSACVPEYPRPDNLSSQATQWVSAKKLKGKSVHSIAVAGHLCLDITPLLPLTARVDPGSLVEVGPLAVTLGGCVANTGGALANLGTRVVPYATIGDDELGALLRTKLAAEGFASPQLSISQHLSTSYSLVIEQSGADRTLWHHTGANADFDGAAVDTSEHSLLHIGYPPLLPGLLDNDARKLTDLLSRAQSTGVTTSIDLAVVDPNSTLSSLNWDSIMPSIFSHSDIVTPSLDDLTSAFGIREQYSPELVDRLADRLLDDGVAVVVISAGQHGLRLRTASQERLRSGGAVLAPLADTWADRSLTISPLRVENPVTTNGAGDASTAGLLYAITQGGTPEQSAALAVACSAAVIRGEKPTPKKVTELDSSLSSIFSMKA